MDEEVISIDKICAHARAAAERNEAPATVRPYRLGSTESRVWMIEFTKSINRLIAHDRQIARDALPGEDLP